MTVAMLSDLVPGSNMETSRVEDMVMQLDRTINDSPDDSDPEDSVGAQSAADSM